MREDVGRLPPAVGDSLAPQVRDALNHPTRRRILRALNAVSVSQTVLDLRGLLPEKSVSALSYHIWVLERHACVTVVAETVHDRGGRLRAYGSNISDDRAVMGALAAMRSEDERDV